MRVGGGREGLPGMEWCSCEGWGWERGAGIKFEGGRLKLHPLGLTINSISRCNWYIYIYIYIYIY